MSQPESPLTTDPEPTPGPTQPPLQPTVIILAIFSGAVGAVAGGWITDLIPGIYIPLLPGVVVGYAVLMTCRTPATPVAIIAAVFGFASHVIFEAFNMADGLSHLASFYATDDAWLWIFRVLNGLIGFWLSRPRL